MQVQQHVHAVDQRTNLARAVELDRMSPAVQRRQVPYAVDVLIDEAGCGGLARIETFIRGEIDEAECQLAAYWRNAGRQQPIEHDGAGDLIPAGDFERRLERRAARD